MQCLRLSFYSFAKPGCVNYTSGLVVVIQVRYVFYSVKVLFSHVSNDIFVTMDRARQTIEA